MTLFLVAILLVGTGLLFAISPGRPAPLRDAAGRVVDRSLSERVTVEIGGIPQGMFIQSVNPANPVLLFLHGGPGMTEFFMEQEYPTASSGTPPWSGGSSAAPACRSRATSRPRP